MGHLYMAGVFRGLIIANHLFYVTSLTANDIIRLAERALMGLIVIALNILYFQCNKSS